MKFKLLFLTILLCFQGCNKNTYEFYGESYKWKTLKRALKSSDTSVALDISNQNLTSLPTEVADVKNLTFINLKGNKLTELPDFLYNNQNLKTLLLYRNNGLSLAPAIKNLTGLEILEIIGCNMIELPSEIYELQNLKRMAIGGNQFTTEQVNSLKAALPNCRIYESID
ncbi:MAG: hypothetical protein OCD76_17420 [Reichenbachiella sp.]